MNPKALVWGWGGTRRGDATGSHLRIVSRGIPWMSCAAMKGGMGTRYGTRTLVPGATCSRTVWAGFDGDELVFALADRKRGGVTQERTDLERRRGAVSERLPLSSIGCCDESLGRRRDDKSKEVGADVCTTDWVGECSNIISAIERALENLVILNKNKILSKNHKQ